MKKAIKIIKKIEANSIRPPENKKLIERYLRNSFGNKELITFYNWECPPRELRYDKKVGYYLDFDVALDKIARGEKENKYTELPRAVESQGKEKRILSYLKSLGLNFRFVKIIADTNLNYLSPQTLKIIPACKLTGKSIEFKKLIENATKDYPVNTKVILATKLFKKNINLYIKYFKEGLSLIESGQGINTDIFSSQLKRTIEHIGSKNPTFNKNFAKRTIASYGAEGMIFAKLSKTQDFSNCVWLNIEEVDQRTIEITNFLRKKYKIDPLPMIFLKC